MRYLLLLLVVGLCGCSVAKNYYDKDEPKGRLREYREIEHIDTYKGVFIYRDNRKDWLEQMYKLNNPFSKDCTHECGGGGTTWAYKYHLVICACTNNNLSSITDKTGD